MPTARLKDGPGAGMEIDVPTLTPTLTLRLGSRDVVYEAVGEPGYIYNVDGNKHYYTETETLNYRATDIVERVKTKAPRQKKVPAATFTATE